MTTSGDSATQQARAAAQLIADNDARSTIFAAAALGQHAQAAQRLAADPALARARTADGKTALHFAAQWGQVELARLLLEHGADAAAQDGEGRAPLHTMTGHATRMDLLDLLLAHGADPNAEDHYRNAPLFLTASLIHRLGFEWGAHDQLTQVLLQKGARLDAFTAVILNREAELRALVSEDPTLLLARKRHGYIPDGSTLLHFAADRGHAAATRALLEAGADVTATDSRGRPPLYLAGHDGGARKNAPSREVVDLLLEAGAPLDVFACALLGRIEALEQSIRADPAAVNRADAGGNSPLHLAAWNGQLETARWLLDHGATVGAANARGETALTLAANYGHLAVVNLLLGRGARCSAATALKLARPDLLRRALDADPAEAARPNRYGRTPVQVAAESATWAHTFGDEMGCEKQRENLSVLLAGGAPPEIWSAIVLDQPDEVKRRLDEQPGVLNAPDNGSTPLHEAAVLGRLAVAEVLIGREAALEARDFSGATPLRRAAGFIVGIGHGHAQMADLLLRHGADIDARNNWNDTPAAVALATPAVAEVMLAHGAPLTIHAAAALGRRDTVTALLAEDPERLNQVGTFGFTPLNWAVINGHAALVADLLDRGAPLDNRAWGRSLLAWAEQCGQREVAEVLRLRATSERSAG